MFKENTIIKILRYIFSKNKLITTPKYLINGFIFQVFSRLSNKIISKTIFNGKKIFLYPRCTISSTFVYTDIPDKEEINILRDLAKNNKNSIFLDIGANIGSYSISMMDVCNEVIAFEPHPYTNKRCKLNFLLNNYSEEKVNQIGLADTIGELYFSDYGESSTVNHIIDTNDGIKVKVTTLDNFIVDNKLRKNRPYILKIDVEGYEEQVLKGGVYFLTKYNIKGIVFECFSKDNVFKILEKYKYKNIIKLSENNYLATK